MSDNQACMSEEAARREKWYRHWRFPLLPTLSVRSRDKFNSSDFNFHWLFFRCWSGMSPDIGLEVMLTDQEFIIRMHLPYLCIGVFIPLFPRRWTQKTWRITRIKDWNGTHESSQWRNIL